MTINIFVANKTFPSFLFVFSQQALSNVHSVRATATDKDPLTWNFNPKVLSAFTLLTLYREILVIRLQYPSFLASILRYKAEANGELIVLIKLFFVVKVPRFTLIIDNRGVKGILCRTLLDK